MAEKRRRAAAAAAAGVARTVFLLVVLGAGTYILTHRGGAGGALPAPATPRGRTLAEYDVESPFRTHGRLKKRGPLGALAMVGSGLSRAELCFPPAWREARLAGDKQAPPAKWCAIMFNDKYKLVYVKCPKTAGTTLVTYFTDCSAPDAADRCFRLLDYTNATMVGPRRREARLRAGLAGTLTAAEAACFGGASGACLPDQWPPGPPASRACRLSQPSQRCPALPPRLCQVQHLLDSWDDYFAFSFSRNVLRRAISQYQVRCRDGWEAQQQPGGACRLCCCCSLCTEAIAVHQAAAGTSASAVSAASAPAAIERASQLLQLPPPRTSPTCPISLLRLLDLS